MLTRIELVAELLKNHFGPDIPVRIAEMILPVFPEFESDYFVQDAVDGYEALELKERSLKIAQSLRLFLPDDYEKAVEILVASIGPEIKNLEGQGMAPFLYWPHVNFVHEYGLGHFEASMAAQHALTQRFTAEFSIRPFLEQHTKATLARLRIWAMDPSLHVRRLVSEGTRPRLPWASRLREFQRDPTPVLSLLEMLKDDAELYVRRSVANNLNDIGKDHPDLLVDIARRWSEGASKERLWLVRHALRSAVKRGDRGALAVLGYGDDSDIDIEGVRITPGHAVVGDKISVEFDVINRGSESRPVMVDFRIHYVKKNGKPRPKVFKLKSVDLEPGEAVRVKKSISLREMTTRTHYPGVHKVDAILNGGLRELGSFQLEQRIPE